MASKESKTRKPSKQKREFMLYTFLFGIFLFIPAWLCKQAAFAADSSFGTALGYGLWAIVFFYAGIFFMGLPVVVYIFRQVRIGWNEQGKRS